MTDPRFPQDEPPRKVVVRDRRQAYDDALRAAPGPQGTGPEPHPVAAPHPPAEASPAEAALAEQLSQELDDARAQAAGYLDDLQRLKAEFDNYRKRILREQTAIMERASEPLVRKLLPVLDNFDLAVASAEESHDFHRMLKGIEMVFGELKGVLSTEGVERIAAKGQPFDPRVHEAALEVGTGDGEPHVVEELRSGYTFKGAVLRPAMVKVARGPVED